MVKWPAKKMERATDSSSAARQSSEDLMLEIQKMEESNAFLGPPRKKQRENKAEGAEDVAPTKPKAPWQEPTRPRASSWRHEEGGPEEAASSGVGHTDVSEEIGDELEMFSAMTQELGEHPWAVRGNRRHKSTDLTEMEQSRLKTEEIAARNAGMTWKDRGPVEKNDVTDEKTPVVPFWRGNPWRSGDYGGKKRFAKRGGHYKEYYSKLNKQGLLIPGRHGARRITKEELEKRSAEN